MRDHFRHPTLPASALAMIGAEMRRTLAHAASPSGIAERELGLAIAADPASHRHMLPAIVGATPFRLIGRT